MENGGANKSGFAREETPIHQSTRRHEWSPEMGTGHKPWKFPQATFRGVLALVAADLSCGHGG